MKTSPSPSRRLVLSAALLTLAAYTAPAQQTQPSASTKPAEPEKEDVVVLSPFEVNGANDQGYQALSTLSGTRLNSALEDLAASISVVTKQQLLDTASVDINDVFRYELNTEGIYQYTDYTLDRGNVSDNVASNPNGANRMRGLTSANIALDGFGSSIPVDTYNIDGVEISRGPNSNIFGLGNAGGSVNFLKAKANAANRKSLFALRADNYGGYRGNFDFNQPLIRDKFGVRILGLYDRKGYTRKPSTDLTRRLEANVFVRPFKYTTINASVESYRNFNQRPNSLTPRDMTTDWLASGSPTWDPITRMVHLADGTSLTYAQVSAAAARPTYYGIDLVNTAFANAPSWYIDDGEMQLYTINRMPNATGTGPNNVGGTNYLLQNGTNYTVNSSSYPLFTPVSISDKSLYDWTSVNLAAPNYETIRGTTATATLEQFFLRSKRQTLAWQAGWVRATTASVNRRFLGTGSNLQVFIDINEKLLDGTTNPYFLRTYVGGSTPTFTRKETENSNYRNVLAYELDLTHEENWLRWIGRHRFTGLTEYQDSYTSSLGYSDTISSTNSWLNGIPPASRNNTNYRSYLRYYVGDAAGQNVDYAPQGLSAPPFTYTLHYYNGVTGKWIDEAVDFGEYYRSGRPFKRLVNTYQAAWQGYLLKDRVVPTLGITRSINRTRSADSAINPTAATNGYYDVTPLSQYGQYDWVQREGTTTTAGVVVKPLSWLNLSYNQSDSFTPSDTVYDAFGQSLPDPTGETKDYGFTLKLLDNRLVISAKQYETLAKGRGTSDLNTIVQRIVRMDLRDSSGDPGLATFLENQLKLANPTWTEDQVDTEVMKLSGVDPAFIRGHIKQTHADNSDAISRGKEVEIVYNPTNYWTMRTTLTQATPYNGNMSSAASEYIAQRWETWTTIKDPVTGALWWTGKGDNNTVPVDWFTNNVSANLALANALAGKRRTQTREYRVNFVTNFKLSGLTDHRCFKNFDVGGAVRWESKGSIGYLGAEPTTINKITAIRDYDPTKPVWDGDNYYFDFNVGYNLKLFENKVSCRLQLNVVNAFENGHLQPISVNPDGKVWAFRIIAPRQFIFSATFQL